MEGHVAFLVFLLYPHVLHAVRGVEVQQRERLQLIQVHHVRHGFQQLRRAVGFLCVVVGVAQVLILAGEGIAAHQLAPVLQGIGQGAAIVAGLLDGQVGGFILVDDDLVQRLDGLDALQLPELGVYGEGDRLFLLALRVDAIHRQVAAAAVIEVGLFGVVIVEARQLHSDIIHVLHRWDAVDVALAAGGHAYEEHGHGHGQPGVVDQAAGQLPEAANPDDLGDAMGQEGGQNGGDVEDHVALAEAAEEDGTAQAHGAGDDEADDDAQDGIGEVVLRRFALALPVDQDAAGQEDGGD